MIKEFINYLKSKRSKKMLLIMLIFILINFLTTVFFTYSLYLLKGIEDLIRMGVIIFCYFIGFIFVIKAMKNVVKAKTKKIVAFFIAITLCISIQAFLGYQIRTIYDPINSINKNQVTYTSSLIVLNTSNISKLSEMKKLKIGIIESAKSKEDNNIANEIIKENKLKDNNKITEYDDYFDMVNDLYDKKIDAVIVPDNYSIMFGTYEKFQNMNDVVKVIVSKDKTFKKQKTENSSNKSVSKEPFTILLMGVDSEKDGLDKNAAFNGDSLMLITFNPKTLTTTTLSIPRDTYVPIMCFKNQKKNKITHAAWYGADCMIKTIENFTGIDIDYYVKMNFKGVVGLVNALGGIDINVPMNFCEQNSDRQFGKKTICLKTGYQHLNGEQALALARHRKTLLTGDIQRGLNQQLVIQGMTQKLSKIDSIDKFNKILNSVTKNMDTDLSTDQILSFYNVGKDILLKGNSVDKSNLVNIQKLFLEGYGAMIYDEGFKTNLYEYIYYKNSLNAVVDAMKTNLGIKAATLEKEFSFDVNETYEETIIGKGKTEKEKIITLLNLTGRTKSYVTNYCSNNNIKCSFITIDENNPLYKSVYFDGQIINQSIPSGTELSKVSSIVFKVIEKSSEDSSTNSNNNNNSNDNTTDVKDNNTTDNSTNTNDGKNDTNPGPDEGE